jgi:hypothetical protein
MRIGTVQIERQPEWVELSTCVSSPRVRFGRAKIWFRVPPAFEAYLDNSANWAVAGLYLCAAALGEGIESESAVSPRLIENCKRIHRLISTWPRTDTWKMTVRPVSVSAPESRGDGAPTDRVGCFFTLGVDSFHSLLTRPDITHLIFVTGYDLPLSPGYLPLVKETLLRIEQVAQRSTKTFLPLSTNLRVITDPIVGWEMNHGAALAAAGLCLGQGFSDIIISSSDAYLSMAPYGTHPDLDPLWSTEMTRFRSHGTELKRSEKVRAIAQDPLFQRHVRVCWENRDLRYNCMNCMKCLRTMLQLQAFNALGKVETLQGPLPLHILDKAIEPRQRWFVWEDLLREMPDKEENRILRQCIQRMLQRSRVAGEEASSGASAGVCRAMCRAVRDFFRHG